MKIAIDQHGNLREFIFDTQAQADDYFADLTERLELWYSSRVKEATYLKHKGMLQRTNEQCEKWRKDIEDLRGKVKIAGTA